MTSGLALTGSGVASDLTEQSVAAIRRLSLFHGVLSASVEDALGVLRDLNQLSPEEGACLRALAAGEEPGLGVSAAHTAAVVAGIWERAATTYARRGIGEVRWNGTANTPSWDLSLPQSSAMTITEVGERILLLRRPASDYLYPGLWTIPGGYLEVGERPEDAAPREVLEETGTSREIRAMGDGRPILSDRLAAFPFVSRISETDDVRISEHSAYSLVPLRDALQMALTPEARLVLENYAGQRMGAGK
ncbi:hypothetical protein GCM10027059_44580 [Myceligenerans halotolerans]